MQGSEQCYGFPTTGDAAAGLIAGHVRVDAYCYSRRYPPFLKARGLPRHAPEKAEGFAKKDHLKQRDALIIQFNLTRFVI